MPHRHSFTERGLVLHLSAETENSLWCAIRSLEQRHNPFQTLTERYCRTGNQLLANDYLKRMEELKGHIEKLKGIIVSNMNLPNNL